MAAFNPKLIEIDLESLSLQGNVRHDPQSIDSLALSLKTIGPINPIIVLQEGGGYRVISGQRRVLAAKKLGWKKYRAFVAENLNQAAELLIAASDNLQREAMSVPDIADAAMKLEKLTGKPDSHIAKLLNISPSKISQARSAMAEINAEAQAILAEANAAMFVWFAIRKLPDALQAPIAKQAIEEKTTREELLKMIKGNLPARPKVYRFVFESPSEGGGEAFKQKLKDLLARIAAFERQNLGFDDFFRLL